MLLVLRITKATDSEKKNKKKQQTEFGWFNWQISRTNSGIPRTTHFIVQAFKQQAGNKQNNTRKGFTHSHHTPLTPSNPFR